MNSDGCPFWSLHSSPPACLLQGWPLNSPGLSDVTFATFLAGDFVYYCFSPICRGGDLSFTRHWLTVRISFNAALIPNGVHTLFIPSLRPLTYGRLYIRGRGNPTREFAFCENVFLTRSVGKPSTWNTSWGARLQLSWRCSHRFGWLCLTCILTPL